VTAEIIVEAGPAERNEGQDKPKGTKEGEKGLNLPTESLLLFSHFFASFGYS
jgi:hypothetical protein